MRGVRNRRRRRSQECRTGGIRGESDHEQRDGDLFAWLTRCGRKSFYTDRRKQQNGKQRSTDHPAYRSMKPGTAKMQNLVEVEIADGFDQTGQYEPKRKNQCRAIVGAAETHQSIGCITKT